MDRTKNELVTALSALIELHPNWRFGQLIANLTAWAGQDEPANIWDVSDADLLRTTLEYLRGQNTPITQA